MTPYTSRREALLALGFGWLAPLLQAQAAGLQRQPIEDPGGHALRQVRAALRRTRAGALADGSPALTRILHYGDSHAAANLMTADLRELFRRDFGDAGPGFVPAVTPPGARRRQDLRLELTRGWNPEGLREPELREDNRVGLAGTRLVARGGGQSVRASAWAGRFELFLLRGPDGGEAAVSLDGRTEYGALELLADAPTASLVGCDTGDDAHHELELRTLHGVTRLFGLAAERHVPGVVYDALGINGARASRLLGTDAELLALHLTRRAPDLIVVAYGSNEAGDPRFDRQEYTRQFRALLERLRGGAPQASLLVLAPPDRELRVGRRFRPLPVVATLAAAQHEAARDAGAAFWNLYRGMGGSGSIRRWAAARPALAQPDHVHLTSLGYRVVAEALYHALRAALA